MKFTLLSHEGQTKCQRHKCSIIWAWPFKYVGTATYIFQQNSQKSGFLSHNIITPTDLLFKSNYLTQTLFARIHFTLIGIFAQIMVGVEEGQLHWISDPWIKYKNTKLLTSKNTQLGCICIPEEQNWEQNAFKHY